ncbi:hypothetical protein PWY87_27675 [Kribbella solani]|uniref:hypothetical protein n=1 Tax=Kribbella solani TaxID=236067 RepID=UPI0029B9E8B5|nr:hypothetical protein [Kribbella solani]MDX2971749.1 hypothetical protein [Kribbella solani]MDX3005489.1 hypothetical protein [Kribbella solani]
MLTKILGAVGAVLLIVGVVFAVRPISAAGDSCGSVFQPDKGITPMQCDARLSSRGTLVIGFGAGGVALLLAAFATATLQNRRNPTT